MNKAMHILHISSHASWRGGEQQISYLFDELRQYDCLQWVLCAEGNAMETYCNENGLPHYSYQNFFIKSFKNRKLLTDLCEKHKIDIIHVHDSHSHTLAFTNAIFGNTVPIVVSRRVDFPVRDSFFSRKKYNHESIKKYLCVSNKIMEILKTDIEDHSKLIVIHSGIDTKRFESKVSTNILRKEFHILPEQPIIGNIASLADHKDYFTFVDTAGILVEKGINAKFLIVGDGPLEEEIRKYVLTKNLEKSILMTGFRNDIPDILPEFDVFLFTSKTEGLGTSILDAFACKVPVVSTNAGGIPEMVVDGVNGLLADISDAKALSENVLLILNNAALKSKLVNAAYETLADFSKKDMAKKTFQVYQEILKQEGKI